MCVILACDKEFPSLDVLKSCELMNSDGGGIAWNELNPNTNEIETHFKKGLNAEQIHELIESKKVKIPAVIHFRIATVGTATAELTHPFVISKTSRLDTEGKIDYTKEDGVLFHNGTVSEHNKILKEAVMSSNTKMLKGEYSDSRVMAFVSYLYGHEFLKLIDGWNKFCILDKSGITKYGNWVNISKGINGSNDYFKGNTNVYSMYSDEDDFMYPRRGHVTYSKGEIEQEVESDEDTDEQSLIEEFETINKSKELKQVRQILKSYKKAKKGNLESKRKFLKRCGWVHSENLSKKHVEQYFIVEGDMQKRRERDLMKKEFVNPKLKSKKMNSEDYEEIFKQNEHWVNQSVKQNSMNTFTPVFP